MKKKKLKTYFCSNCKSNHIKSINLDNNLWQCEQCNQPVTFGLPIDICCPICYKNYSNSAYPPGVTITKLTSNLYKYEYFCKDCNVKMTYYKTTQILYYIQNNKESSNNETKEYIIQSLLYQLNEVETNIEKLKQRMVEILPLIKN